MAVDVDVDISRGFASDFRVWSRVPVSPKSCFHFRETVPLGYLHSGTPWESRLFVNH